MATWYVQMVGDPPILSTHEACNLWIEHGVWRLVDEKGATVAAFPPDAILGVWEDQRPEFTFDPSITKVWFAGPN